MKIARSLFVVLMLALSGSAGAQMDAQFDLNVKESPVRGVLEMIAAKSGLQLVMGHDPGINLTLSQTGMTARQLLDQITGDQQLEYTISGNQLIVTKRGLGGTSIGDSHLIHIQFANASDVAGKLKTVIGGEDRVVVDERENNIIFMGSRANFEKAKSLVALLDSMPKQIMIEALIVETSHSFMQELGISLAGLGDSVNTPGPRAPYGTFKTVLDSINGKSLEMRLNVAESKGDAKVISRPKVITLNNKSAQIQSGITYYVKTLSNVVTNGASGQAVPGGGGQVAGIAAGGITPVKAGLSLNILPSIVGSDDVKLVVDIDNSTSDMGSAVDGIPGIFKNSANTNVIVKNKQTAVIAGLIKQQKSKSSGGVPILSDIPLIGLLFKSSTKADQNNELVIFLTPTVGNPETAHVDPETGMPVTPALAADVPAKK